MARITEDYVSFETAKLLKEKGFDEKCRTYYKVFPKDRIAAIYHSSEDRGVSEDDPNEILCPTLQMAMKWLREVHNIDIFPRKIDKGIYSCAIFNSNTGQDLSSAKYFPSEKYEETVEAGIEYCLKTLI